MPRHRTWPEAEAERVLQQARSEFAALGEPWDNYEIDVELVGTLLFDLGVQRADLRIGQREYAGFLDPRSKLVGIEQSHHEHRQRFSMAHEIGHYVLHVLPRPESGGLFACTSADMEVSDPSGARSRHIRQEWEANLFASALLMPEPSVQAMHKVTGGRLFSLAKHFRVSPKAMEIRLKTLDLPFKEKS